MQASPGAATDRRWGWLAAALALLVLGTLGVLLARERSLQDADEAVHSIEALRLADALGHGELGDFCRKSYFPERWQPPVQDHLRWYAPLHAWIQAGVFLVFGASDTSARLSSLALLAASLALFWKLARALAPVQAGAAGCAAVALALSAPNLLTFGGQALIESCSLCTCWLALLCWLRSLEAGHSARRAALAGLALGLAFLAKYDHGLLLIFVLGISEVVRARGNVLRLLRSGAALAFALAALIGAAWLAHPDKWAAFLDAARHPFYGSPRLIALNLAATWFLEHSANPLLALLVIAAPVLAWRDLFDERRRVLWLYAVLSYALLASRARFLFRYDFCEAPAMLVLTAVHLPQWIERAGARLERLSWTRLALAALCAACALESLLRPCVEWLVSALFTALYDAAPGHMGLSLAPSAYLEALFTGLRRAWALFGPVLAWSGLALVLIELGLRGRARAWAICASAWAIGLAFLLARLPWILAWELEGPPQLHALTSAIAEHAPLRGRILLGGGWDQYANNTLRWYLLSGARRETRFDDLEVVGDMIGSLVLPAAPRIAQWTNALATQPTHELPQLVALIDMQPDFAYRCLRTAEVDLYRATMQRRGGFRQIERRVFPELGLVLELYASDTAGAPIADWRMLAPAEVPNGVEVGAGGWVVKDDAWRMLRAPGVKRDPGPDD